MISMTYTMGSDPLSIYIHIPYCIHKCSYCDFYSVGVGRDAVIPGERYMARVGEELRAQVARLGLAGREIRSVFFGGGTPSMVPGDFLGTFLDLLPTYFSLPPQLEISCEANPETLGAATLQAVRAAGINRLSIGVQSFQPRHLHFMERIHSPERAEQAIRDAQTAGFTNINLDLIFGLPDQTMDELADDLARALALGTQHISAYQLTVEPSTPLAVRVQRKKITPIDDERAHLMWETVRARLSDAGFPAYEVSNYARPGFACVHNQHYWRSGEYLGLGAGAVSRIGNTRWRRARQTQRYLAGDLMCDEEETLTPETQRFEYLMLALRTAHGLDLRDFQQRFGQSFDAYYPETRQGWIAAGYAHGDQSLQLTPHGLAILDSLLMDV